MKNRNLTSPILSALASLLFVYPLLSRADLTVPSATTSLSVSPDAARYVPPPTTSPATASSIPAGSSPTASSVTPKHTAEYTVVAGDSLTKIAQKFNTTRKKLRELNNISASVVAVKPGQILLVPSSKKSKSATALATAGKIKTHHDYLKAQPVQDFDIPASTFASCPVPVPSDDPVSPVAPTVHDVSQQPEASAQTAPPPEFEVPAPSPEKQVANALPPTVRPKPGSLKPGPVATASTAPSGLQYPPPSTKPALPRLTNHGFSQTQVVQQPAPSPATNDVASRFIQEARLLGDLGIEYDDDWRPPGERHAWTMDCSNTTRYIYKVTTGIQLPRTASDQYYYLHLQGKAWDVPQTAAGWADSNYLRQNLKPGDLLFWENTYRPERQPPITHVMVFLGANERGQWIMAGSQSSRGGAHNRRNGGPDIYVFRPSQPCGGYTTWMGLVHHQGRFCAFGRPLEADPSKLAVAASD